MVNKNEFKKVKNISFIGDGLFVSTNYNFFSFYKGNRYTIKSDFDCSMLSAQEIKEAERKAIVVKLLFRQFAIEQGAPSDYLFDKDIPIIVAKIGNKYYVVDGQNRLAVCEQLGIPFYFRLLENVTDEVTLLSYIKRMNYTKTSWTKSQQIGSEARLGNVYAQELIRMEKKYEIPSTNIVYFALGKGEHKIKATFTVKPFDIEKANKIASFIVKIADMCTTSEKNSKTLRKDNRFTNFITRVCECGVQDLLIKSAQINKVNKIKGATSLDNYADAFKMIQYI